jgi:sporulation protein YlmC with PRC-barrel domain
MEAYMLKMQLAAGLAAAALTAGAMAQTPSPTQPADPGPVMVRMPPDLMRGFQLIGVDVYGADNQKIGDIDEVLVDPQGKVHGFVVGVGGFLGLGQKDVAIPFDQVQWMSYQEVRAFLDSDQSGYGTNTAGNASVPSPAAGGTTQPSATAKGGDANLPARALVKMTTSDLQNAPEFIYPDDQGSLGAASNISSPRSTVKPPGNTPSGAAQQ